MKEESGVVYAPRMPLPALVPSKEEKSNMKMPRVVSLLFAAAAAIAGAGLLAKPAAAQNPMSFPETKSVFGLEGVKHDTTGTLSVEKGNLVFTAGKKKVEIPASSITEVMTGKDSTRSIGGTVGTLTEFAPYGVGRFLSLFRDKIDTLSVEYRDASGGVHGTVFALVQGNSLGAKKALVDSGAKTSVPVEVEADEPAAPKEKKQ
jgi:hypothetical protein